jgi:4-amino-4-deoxy-L-arabinose transferase-like glycosyltransferase
MPLLVVALAIALRVAWVLAVPTKPVGDFAMYVEAAAHLVEHGAFDSEYVYMPGYIFLIAPVQALGGGWLATKLVGAVLGGLGAGAVYGIARRLAGNSSRVAMVAGLLYAFWPAGIAIASVTGTDMPAAVLLVAAVYFLIRFAQGRPLLAAILFGVFTGLAAYIRAIVIPLAALSFLVFRAQGKSWRKSITSAAVACAVALMVLSPWAVRNRWRYGETFFTDSHGGLTALVGANPNTLGRYSRSLNRMFRDVTGYALLAEPHRDADRAAMAIAKDWISFDPRFTLGLLASKAERLLVHERALLYWPLFRAGVLPEPWRGFFGGHQRAIENVADSFYLATLALALAGCALAYARRNWLALSLLPQAFALIVLYTAIFSEPRYRLPIYMLLIPFAALALDGVWQTAAGLVHATAPSTWKRQALAAVAFAAVVFAAGPLLAWGGAVLRLRHAWTVSECSVAGHARLCTWRGDGRGEAPGLSGVWNGVGLPLPREGANHATVTETQISLAAGDYSVSARLDLTPAPSTETRAEGTILMASATSNASSSASSQIALADVADKTRAGQFLPWSMKLHHAGGPLVLRMQVEIQTPPRGMPPNRLWLSDLEIVDEPKP